MAEPVIRLGVVLNNPSNVAQVQKFIQGSLNNTPVNVKINVSGAGGAKATLSNINNINKAMSSLNKSANVSSSTFTKAFRDVDNFGRALARSDSGLSKINKQFKSVNSSIKETTSRIERFSNQITLAGHRYAAFAVSSTAIIGAFAGINEGIEQAIKYQKELIRFQQVGGDTVTSIKGISKEIRQLSKEFGASSLELAKTAVTLRQAGYSADEVKSSLDALAKSALAPNFDSLEQTVEGLIALNSQFNKSLRDSEKALSQINAVAGAYAAEASDLVIGVQKLGGAFSAAGGSFEELLGVMTAVRSTTRESADTIATGLRTILARTQRSTTIADLEKLGISLRADAAEAKQFGIQVGGILPIFARLQKLSSAASGLSPSDPRFSQILEIVGGIRQISKTTPILLSFNKAVDATNLALRSTNTLTKDAALAQKSLDTQLKELKESFLALFETFGGNKFLKGIIEGFTQGSKALNEFSHRLEPLIPIIAALGARGIFGVGSNIFKGLSRGIPISARTQTGLGGSGLFIKRNQGGLIQGFNDGGLVQTPFGRIKQSRYGRYYNLDKFLENNVGQRVRLRRVEADPITGSPTARAQYYAQHRQNRFGSRIGRRVGGIVPGPNVNADIIYDELPAGSFVLNRDTAAQIVGFNRGGRLGFDRGGKVPVALTPGELTIPPEVVQKIGVGNLSLMNASHGKAVTPELKDRLIRYLVQMPGAPKDLKFALKHNFIAAGGNPSLVKGLNRGGMVRMGFAKGGELPDDILALLLSQRQDALEFVKSRNRSVKGTKGFTGDDPVSSYRATIQSVEELYPGTKKRLAQIFGKNIGEGSNRVANPQYYKEENRRIREQAREFSLVGLGRGKLRASEIQSTDRAIAPGLIRGGDTDLADDPSGHFDRNNPVRRSIIGQRLTPELTRAAERILRAPNPVEFIRILKKVSGKKSGEIIQDIVDKGLFYGDFTKRVGTGEFYTNKKGKLAERKTEVTVEKPDKAPTSILGLISGNRGINAQQRLELLRQYVQLPKDFQSPESAPNYNKQYLENYSDPLQQLRFIQERTGLNQEDILSRLEKGNALIGNLGKEKTALRDFSTFTNNGDRKIDIRNAADVFGLDQADFPAFGKVRTSAILQGLTQRLEAPTNPRLTPSRVQGEANPSQVFQNLPGSPVAGSLNGLPIPRYARSGSTPLIVGGLGRSFPFLGGGSKPPNQPPIVAGGLFPEDEPLFNRSRSQKLRKLGIDPVELAMQAIYGGRKELDKAQQQVEDALNPKPSLNYRGGVHIIGGGRPQKPQESVPILRSGIPLVDSGIILGANGLPISSSGRVAGNSRGRISTRLSKGKTIGDLLSVSSTLREAGIGDSKDFRAFAKSIGLPISIPQVGPIKGRALANQSLDNDYIRYITQEVLKEAKKQNESRRNQSLIANRREIELNQINRFTSNARVRRFNEITSGRRGVADDTRFDATGLLSPNQTTQFVPLSPTKEQGVFSPSQFNSDVLKSVIPNGVRFNRIKGIFEDQNIKKTTQEITSRVALITVREALDATGESLDSFIKKSGLNPKTDQSRIDGVLNQVIPFSYQQVANKTTSTTPAIPLGSPIPSENADRRNRFIYRIRRGSAFRYNSAILGFRNRGSTGAILGTADSIEEGLQFGGTPGSLDLIRDKSGRITGVGGGKKFNRGFNIGIGGGPQSGFVRTASGRLVRSRRFDSTQGKFIDDRSSLAFNPSIDIQRRGSGILAVDKLKTQFGKDLNTLKALKEIRGYLNRFTDEIDITDSTGTVIGKTTGQQKASELLTQLAKRDKRVFDSLKQTRDEFINTFVRGQEQFINDTLRIAASDAGVAVPNDVDFASPQGGVHRNKTLGTLSGFRGSFRSGRRAYGQQVVDRAFQRDIQLGLRRVGLGKFQNLSGILAQDVTNANINNIRSARNGAPRKEFSDTTTNLVNDQFGVFRNNRLSLANRLGFGIGQQSVSRSRSNITTRQVPTGNFIVSALDHTGNEVEVPIRASNQYEALQLARQQGHFTYDARRETRTERVNDPRLRRSVARRLQGLSQTAAPRAVATILNKGESVLSDLVKTTNTVRFQRFSEGDQLEYLARRAKRLGLTDNIKNLDVDDLRALTGAGQEVNNLNNRRGFFRKATGTIQDLRATSGGRALGGVGNRLGGIGSAVLLGVAASSFAPKSVSRDQLGNARISGALQGVATGALAGSVIGPEGAVIGAVIGGFTGAARAAKDFEKQLEDIKFDKAFGNLSRELSNIVSRNNNLTGKDINSVSSFIRETEQQARKRFTNQEERNSFLNQSFGSAAPQLQSIIGLIGRTPGLLSANATPEQNLQKFFDFGNGQGASIARAYALGNNLTQPEANKAIQEQLKNTIAAQQSAESLKKLDREATLIENRFSDLANAIHLSSIQYQEASKQLGAFSLALENNRIVPPSLSGGIGALGVLGGQDNFNRSAQFISNLLPERVIGTVGGTGGIPPHLTNRQSFFGELTSANQAAISLPDILRTVAADPLNKEGASAKITDLLEANGGISKDVIGRISDALDALGNEELNKQLENPQDFAKSLVNTVIPNFDKLTELTRQLEESTQGFINALQDGRQIELRERAFRNQGSELQSTFNRQAISFAGLPNVINPLARQRQSAVRSGNFPATVPQFAGGATFEASLLERRFARSPIARRLGFRLPPTTLTGGDPSLALSINDLNQPFLQSQSRLIGPGINPLNPIDINNRLQSTLGDIDKGKIALANAATPEDQNSAITNLNNLQNTAEDLNQALSNLADITQVNAAAQEKLIAIEQERSGRLNFAERFIQSNPLQRAQILGSLNQASIATRVGLDRFNPIAQGNILNTLRQVGDVQTTFGATGNQLADQLIQRSSIGNFINNNPLLNTGRSSFGQLEQARQGAQGEILQGTARAVRAAELLAQNTAREREQFFQTLTQNQENFLQNLGKTIGLSEQEAIKQRISNIQIANKDNIAAVGIGRNLIKSGVNPDDINKIVSENADSFAKAREAQELFDFTRSSSTNFLSDVKGNQFNPTVSKAVRAGGVTVDANQLSPKDEERVRDLITRSSLGIDQDKAIEKINTDIFARSSSLGRGLTGAEVGEIARKNLTVNTQQEIGQAFANRSSALVNLQEKSGIGLDVIQRLTQASDQQLNNIQTLSEAINNAGGTFQGLVEQFNNNNRSIQELRDQLNQASQIQLANADSLKRHGEQMADFAAVIKDAKIKVESQNRVEVVLNGAELLNRLTENVKNEVVRQAVETIKAELTKEKIDGVS